MFERIKFLRNIKNKEKLFSKCNKRCIIVLQNNKKQFCVLLISTTSGSLISVKFRIALCCGSEFCVL